MPSMKEITDALAVLPLDEQEKVLQALRAADSERTFSELEITTLRTRAATPPDAYQPWERVRDNILLGLMSKQ